MKLVSTNITKEVNPRLVKPPLNFSGGLLNLPFRISILVIATDKLVMLMFLQSMFNTCPIA